MKVTAICGGQFGSEGKGAVAGELHKRRKYDLAIRVGGPNAGHTVYDADGNKFALRQIPVAAAVDPDCRLHIAEGSEIDVRVLTEELSELEAAGHSVRERLTVSPEATVITHADYELEQGVMYGNRGSTRKGVGAARAHRAMRSATRVRDVEDMFLGGNVALADRPAADTILIEGTQGYGLGSHAGYYPYCTSGDCRAIDFLAQAGLPPSVETDVWVVLRTYPIRIAGESGPLTNEIDWARIGVEPEFTTVTKKMRRVGTWDANLARRAITANGGGKNVSVALTFFDYWYKDLARSVSVLDLPLKAIQHVEHEIGAGIRLLGTSGQTFIPIGEI